jgi:DNA-binding transcriptional LysR family regulator
MELTEAGQALPERVPTLLTAWDDVVRETRSTASRSAHVLRVGYVASAANEATQQIVSGFAIRQPDWRIEMRQASWSDPSAGLDDGAVDAAIVRLPFPGRRHLRVEVLFTEPDGWLFPPRTHWHLRPVTGVSPNQVAVAWPPAADTNPIVHDFVRCCREAVGEDESELERAPLARFRTE